MNSDQQASPADPGKATETAAQTVPSRRAGGILLHPTSFPGPYGIGDLGGEAYRFVDFLQQTGQKLWQILPLSPTGYGDSPYAAFSAFAGNPLLISPDILGGMSLLEPHDLLDVPGFPPDRVDYGPVIEWKMGLLKRSYTLFKSSPVKQFHEELARFEKENASWLEDYALFMAVKAAHGGITWSDWEQGIALRLPDSIAAWSAKLEDEIRFQKYIQFLFSIQWMSLKKYANERNVHIVGDIPIFVAYDSADVWAHPELFHLDEKGRTTVVAGVPPDYFSATGQYWGNPLYRWDVLADTGYAWWLDRFRNAFRLYDYVRLDHFRGFAAYWEVPVNDEQTAANGHWVKGPGLKFFQAVLAALGDQPIIAEDLGVITPDVVEIREAMGFPGMRVLQFAFGAFETDATDPYLPHNYLQNTVVYTGTHDNDTTVAWFLTASAQEQANVKHYLDLDQYGPNTDPVDMARLVAGKLVRLAYSSVADMAIVPLQDLLGAGNEGRMNWPGRAEGNWSWRFHPDSLSDPLRAALRDITILFARYIPPTDRPLKGQGNI
ncbi:MAG: 4-alpha-glucanotransferase [Chloroflexota bacterium]